MATKKAEDEKQESIAMLRDILAPGTTVYTCLRHRAASGMTRWLDVYVVRDNEIHRLTWHVCKATGYTYDRKHEALKVGGCGFDAGFAVVSDLSYYLHPEDVNILPEESGRPVRPSVDKYKRGYSLNHRWLG